jgi:serine/threonine-protein kinase
MNARNSGYCTAAGQFGVSAAGLLIYAPGGVLPDMQNSLVWVDRQGKGDPIASFKAPFLRPRLSPDGHQIAYLTHGLEKNLWVYDLNRGTATKVTSEGTASFPTWLPDGRRLAFAWEKTGVLNIYCQAADGSTPMERITQSEVEQDPGSWSPDGKTLAFVEARSETDQHILLLNLADRHMTPFLNSRFTEGYPEFSPDGQWMAYVSDETGRGEVYVQSIPPGRGKWRISDGGGFQPIWARSGKQLFYRSGGTELQGLNQVWVVDVQTGTTFSVGKPKLLFEQPGYGVGDPIRAWDVAPDGERFLMVKLEERKPQPLTGMVLVQNWFEEVRRLAPTKK